MYGGALAGAAGRRQRRCSQHRGGVQAVQFGTTSAESRARAGRVPRSRRKESDARQVARPWGAQERARAEPCTVPDAFFLSIRPDYVIEIRRIGLTGSGWRSGIGGIWRRKVWMAAHDSWRKPSAKGIAGIWCNQPDICASDAAPQHL